MFRTTNRHGTKCAPYLATRSLVELANSETKYPLASQALLEQCYMDDILTGANSDEELIELYSEINQLLNSANFKLHKWSTNNLTIFQNKENKFTFNDIPIKETFSKILGIY